MAKLCPYIFDIPVCISFGAIKKGFSIVYILLISTITFSLDCWGYIVQDSFLSNCIYSHLRLWSYAWNRSYPLKIASFPDYFGIGFLKIIFLIMDIPIDGNIYFWLGCFFDLIRRLFFCDGVGKVVWLCPLHHKVMWSRMKVIGICFLLWRWSIQENWLFLDLFFRRYLTIYYYVKIFFF